MEDGLRYTVYGEEETIPRPLQQLIDLGNRGKMVQTVYRPWPSSWERLCAVEEDLLNASHSYSQEYEGWEIVSGECVMLEDVTGWLTCSGWVFVAVSKEYAKEHETDFLVVTQEEFDSTFYPQIKARVPLGDDSGIRLNRAIREIGYLEDAFSMKEEK